MLAFFGRRGWFEDQIFENVKSMQTETMTEVHGVKGLQTAGLTQHTHVTA